jgi:putative flippase GtrA
MSGLADQMRRWAKFNAVGIMGMGVQLGVLAVLGRMMRGHYLWATAAAIEVTLIHNFVWHWRFTWRERMGDRVGWWRQFLRFHAANGVVSLVGNLGLMLLLVGGAGLPVVGANAAAIVCCSAANFCAAEWWAFAGQPVGVGKRDGLEAKGGWDVSSPG